MLPRDRLWLLFAILFVTALGVFFGHRFRYAVFAGDMGVKSLQAEAFSHSRVALPYPGKEIDPEERLFPFRPPFVFETPMGWVSVWLNPMVLILIPLFRFLGPWGYLGPPVLGGALACIGMYRLGKEWRLPYPGFLAAVAWVASPLLFYSLILWEHSLATGCALLSLVALLRAVRKRTSLLPAALWLGLSALLRAEVALAGGLFSLAFLWIRRRRVAPKSAALWAIGAASLPVLWGQLIGAMILAPTTAQVIFPYRDPFSPWREGTFRAHLLKCLEILVEPAQDFFKHTPTPILVGLLLVALAPVVGVLLSRAGLKSAGLKPGANQSEVDLRRLTSPRKRTLPGLAGGFNPTLGGPGREAWGLGLAALLLTVFSLATFCALFYRLASGQWFFSGEFLAVPAIVLLPWVRGSRLRPLLPIWGLAVLVLLLSAPNNGGLQQGCRYLLFPSVLGTFWSASLIFGKGGRPWRNLFPAAPFSCEENGVDKIPSPRKGEDLGVRSLRFKITFKALAAIAVGLGILVQIESLGVLYKHKAVKDRTLAAMLDAHPDFVVTSVWYFPQEAGRVLGDLPTVFIDHPAEVRELLQAVEMKQPPPDRFFAVFPLPVDKRNETLRLDYGWEGKAWGVFGGLPVFLFERETAG